MTCTLCFHHCRIPEGKTGFCRARTNRNGTIVCGNYGMLSSLALDPIEKKPLASFYAGSRILSVGSCGCNLRCPFCQNHEIAMAEGMAETRYVSPRSLVQKALELVPQGNIGLAFTYNEPLISYEYVRDCSALARENGLKTVLVTNGTICREPLLELLPLIDAMNIDLKGFTREYYAWLGGDLDTVLETISLSQERCHVEVTTLVVPGRNDSDEEMEALSSWLASLDPAITLHISRFFPHHKLRDISPTPISTVYRLCEIARRHLRYVYAGNC